MTKVAIGIPAFNEEKFIGTALTSALRQFQDFPDLEIIVSDNCSEDQTVFEIEKTLETNTLSHCSVKLLKNSKNMGPVFNFWKVFDSSDSEYFMWLGSHDLISDKYIFHGIEHMAANPDTSMFCGIHRGLTAAGEIIKQDVSYDLNHENAIERYLDSILKLHNCYVFHSIFKRKTLDGYLRTVVPSGDHILISRWLWNGKLHQSQYCTYFRRYFDNNIRQQKTSDGNYLTHKNNLEFFDAYLTDLNNLSSLLPETIRGTILNLASNILINRFGIPYKKLT